MKEKIKHRGYIQVYTGSGKGKTTAALGLALRAAGHKQRVYIGQFLKGQMYGELLSAKQLSPYLTIEQFGRKGFIHVTKDPDKEDIQKAKRGLKRCLEAMLSLKYRIIILDEINVAVEWSLISLEEQLTLLELKPANVELIMTGRYAHPALLEKADLVTEMLEVKHYYGAEGVTARKGFEF